jgi:hypothetical protein
MLAALQRSVKGALRRVSANGSPSVYEQMESQVDDHETVDEQPPAPLTGCHARANTGIPLIISRDRTNTHRSRCEHDRQQFPLLPRTVTDRMLPTLHADGRTAQPKSEIENGRRS